jgi:hypothetical protein
MLLYRAYSSRLLAWQSNLLWPVPGQVFRQQGVEMVSTPKYNPEKVGSCTSVRNTCEGAVHTTLAVVHQSERRKLYWGVCEDRLHS